MYQVYHEIFQAKVKTFQGENTTVQMLEATKNVLRIQQLSSISDQLEQQAK